MSLSDNQKMLLYYAHIFGVDKTYNIKNSLELWGKINLFAHSICEKKLNKNQYLMIKFEDLCLHPKQEIDKILKFAELPLPQDEFIYKIPKKIPSIGRWQNQKDSFKNLDKSALDALSLFGYR